MIASEGFLWCSNPSLYAHPHPLYLYGEMWELCSPTLQCCFTQPSLVDEKTPHLSLSNCLTENLCNQILWRFAWQLLAMTVSNDIGDMNHSIKNVQHQDCSHVFTIIPLQKMACKDDSICKNKSNHLLTAPSLRSDSTAELNIIWSSFNILRKFLFFIRYEISLVLFRSG